MDGDEGNTEAGWERTRNTVQPGARRLRAYKDRWPWQWDQDGTWLDKKRKEVRDMGDAEAVALIIGVIMPFIVTLVKQSGLSHRVNQLIALVACALAGVGTALVTGQFTGTTVVAAIAIVFSIAQLNYSLFFRDTKVEQRLNDATSFV